MTLKQDNPLSGEVEAVLDEILAWLLNTTPDKLGTRDNHNGFLLAKSKLTKLLLEQRIDELEQQIRLGDQFNWAYTRSHLEDRLIELGVKLNQLDKEKQ